MAAVAKDPAIKLFGRTISLPETQLSEDSESVNNESNLMTKAEAEGCRQENYGTVDEAASFKCCKGEQPQISMTRASNSQAISESKSLQEDSDGSEELKPNKKPDKIVPCPRCNSSDTKFCYFNNYNVNQPRHFCKSCQRYWTAGGTVRNVPVGAGRRRNKHLASQYRQILASSDGGCATLIETPDSTNQLFSCEETASSCTASNPNEMVLQFGPESSNCDSISKIIGQSQKSGCSELEVHNSEFYEKRNLPSGSSFSGSSLGVRGINGDQSLHQPLHHSALRPPLGAVVPTSSCSAPMIVPGSTPSNLSVQFVPAPYWNCIPVWIAGPGNISLAVPNGCAPPSFCSNGSGLQVLGKHPRDTMEDEIAGKGISLSKSFRIRDLDEA